MFQLRVLFSDLPFFLKCASICFRKIVALTEEGRKPIISIYDLETLKRKKILSLSDITAEFVSFTFTNDGKGVLAVTGEPDWSLYSFNWEKGKMESTCKATVVGNAGTVAQVSHYKHTVGFIFICKNH